MYFLFRCLNTCISCSLLNFITSFHFVPQWQLPPGMYWYFLVVECFTLFSGSLLCKTSRSHSMASLTVSTTECTMSFLEATACPISIQIALPWYCLVLPTLPLQPLHSLKHLNHSRANVKLPSHSSNHVHVVQPAIYMMKDAFYWMNLTMHTLHTRLA